MPGMHSGLNVTNSVLVDAFRSALMHQGLVALLILASLAVIWVTFREWLPKLRAAGRGGEPGRRDRAFGPQAAADRVRAAVGVRRDLAGSARDGRRAALQGHRARRRRRARLGPHLVNWAGSSWSYHPVAAGAAAVWIQIGIGIWMLASARGPWSRAAGLAGAGWAVVIWVFGEAFGGLFDGQSLLFGFPGAAAYYFAAGVLIALPDKSWASAKLGRCLRGFKGVAPLGQTLLTGLGVLFAAMAVLQAWPGRGFWQGQGPHGPGALTDMITSMAGTPQPAFLGHLVSDFGFVHGHSWILG